LPPLFPDDGDAPAAFADFLHFPSQFADDVF